MSEERHLAELLLTISAASLPTEVRRIMVLTAYVDEGEQSSARVFALAGYLFSPNDCQKFEEVWRQALASVPPRFPPLRRFHMTDWENRREEYANWPDPFRKHFFNRLVSIIRGNTRLSVSVAIHLKAFDSLTSEERFLLNVKTPYQFCVETLLAEMICWLGNNRQTEQVAYVFDDVDMKKGKGILKNSLKCLEENEPERYARFRIASLRWVKAVDAPGIQAADILAYECAKEVAAKLRRSPRPVRGSAKSLLRGTTAANRRRKIIDARMMAHLIKLKKQMATFEP